MDHQRLERAARAIADATAILITAGAGMGVDSGLPDFRGVEGFWRAYPPLKALGLAFEDMANPRWFDTDPALAWGFYGHRLALYRATQPHTGYARLRALAERVDAFVFTSNVDGAFAKAGFAEDRILECHGSIHFLQGLEGVDVDPQTGAVIDAPVVPSDPFDVDVDLSTMRASGPLPRDGTGKLLRPNILLFGDDGFSAARERAQRRRFEMWQQQANLDRLVVIELGAGQAVPTARWVGERLARTHGGVLVRINASADDAAVGRPHDVALALGARMALEALLGDAGR